MSTDGANQGTRWLPRLMGVLLLLMGLALLAGGIKLSQLGGSLVLPDCRYRLCPVGRPAAGQARIALGLYGLVLLGSTVWAMLKWAWTGGNWCHAWPSGSPSAWCCCCRGPVAH
jgi:quinoprotein glucose dehydrogenase (EC 1.1.5.2)